MSSFYFKHGGATHVGLIRGNNEDALLMHRKNQLFVVADGVGGNTYGEVASATAVNAVGIHFKPEQPWSIENSFKQAHKTVQELRKQRSSNMATTLTAFHVGKTGTVQIAHCGDSKLFLLRQGVLKQLTKDHDFYDANLKRRVLYRAVGSDYFNFDNFGIKAKHGDVFLLCTDGLNEAKPQDVQATLIKCARGRITPHRTARQLIKLANAAGGYDNTTAVVVKVLQRKKKSRGA